jgi:hypothetical protein
VKKRERLWTSKRLAVSVAMRSKVAGSVRHGVKSSTRSAGRKSFNSSPQSSTALGLCSTGEQVGGCITLKGLCVPWFVHKKGEKMSVSKMVEEWRSIREEIRRLEELQHSPITDKYGRVWVWKDMDLYTHCGMAWPKSALDNPDHYGLPTKGALDNPNYQFCEICKGN